VRYRRKKFTFAISFPDEFLYDMSECYFSFQNCLIKNVHSD